MTDRIQGFAVTLNHDMREDDVEHVVNALKMVKGVAAVEPVIGDIRDAMARDRVRSDVHTRIFVAVHRIFKEADWDPSQ